MNMNKVKRGDAFERILNRKIEEALSERQKLFPQEHREDSEEVLLNYVRDFTKELGHTPNSNEIIGGEYLKERFGSWEKLLTKAGLPQPGRAAEFKHRLIYKQEKERQLALWRQEKAIKQEEKKLRQLKKAEKKAEKQKRMEEQEKQ